MYVCYSYAEGRGLDQPAVYFVNSVDKMCLTYNY